jgi:hypothetical protein
MLSLEKVMHSFFFHFFLSCKRAYGKAVYWLNWVHLVDVAALHYSDRMVHEDIRQLCAVQGGCKLLQRDNQMLLEATPNVAMHTPSLNQLGGSPPGFPTSPLMAPDASLFTPSSRKLLQSMAPNPLDLQHEMQLDMLHTGLTPQCTPQRTPVVLVHTTAAPSSLSGSSFARKGTQEELYDTPARVTDKDDVDKPTATRRLLFGQNADDADAPCSTAAPPGTTAVMGPPAPPAAIESPFKRRCLQPPQQLCTQKPLFVATETPASICLPETPSQDGLAQRSVLVKRSDASHSGEGHQGGAEGSRGALDGKASAASTTEHAQPSQDSTDTQDKSPVCGDSAKVLAVKGGIRTDSLQLKNKLNNIVDTMFACS